MKPFRTLGDYGAGCCLLFDLGGGGGGSSANETNQTVSGTGRILGHNTQYTESGAISVGQKGKYLEQNAVDASGSQGLNTGVFGYSNLKLAKGANLTINEPAAAGLTGMSSNQPIASTSSTPPPSSTPDPNTGLGNSAPLAGNGGNGTSSSTTPATVPASNWYDSIPGADQVVSFWTGLSTIQQVAAAAAAVLIVWFFIHRRKGA